MERNTAIDQKLRVSFARDHQGFVYFMSGPEFRHRCMFSSRTKPTGMPLA